MKVKCIDNTGNAKNLAELGEYEVTKKKNGLFLIGKDWWAASRFVDVDPCKCKKYEAFVEAIAPLMLCWSDTEGKDSCKHRMYEMWSELRSE